ncbi:unnamed protein product [Lymnaea stagnalis]|uniref:Uncharacterized protein n=1 Tax=Lymnaea stagnalis TaxID=6523 RepID=A0AAV2HNX3_LYMST
MANISVMDPLTNLQRTHSWRGITNTDNLKAVPEEIQWKPATVLPTRLTCRYPLPDESIRTFMAKIGIEVTIHKGHKDLAKKLNLRLERSKLPKAIFDEMKDWYEIESGEIPINIGNEDGYKNTKDFRLDFIETYGNSLYNRQLTVGQYKAYFQVYVRLEGNVQFEDPEFGTQRFPVNEVNINEIPGIEKRWLVKGECVFYLPYHSRLTLR